MYYVKPLTTPSQTACIGDLREGLPIGGFCVGWITGIVLTIIGLLGSWNKLNLIMVAPPLLGTYGIAAGFTVLFVADAISRCKESKKIS